jgi:outer membrane protein assembly factor BamA
MNYYRFILFFPFFLSNVLYSLNAESEKSKPDSSDIARFGIIPLPIFFYTPETRLAGGALLNIYFREPSSNAESRPSSIMPDIIFTQNKQFIIEVSGDIYWNNQNYFNHIYTSFKRYPNKFYGIGNDTPAENEEDYTPRLLSLELSILKRISPSLYIGTGFEYETSKITEYEESGIMSSGEIWGSEGGKTAAIKLQLSQDNRDNVFFPGKGSFIQFDWRIYHEMVGSEYRFQKWIIDLRKYYSIFQSHILVVQGYFSAISGEAPFNKLSLLGGGKLLRGYYEGRYRDNNLLIFQAEYRLHLWWRFGIVSFLGIGDVSNKLKYFKINEFKPSAGLGIRAMMNPQEKLNIRLDWGIGKQTSGLYITIGEAF